MWKVAGQPEKLELEREPERVQLGTSGDTRLVEQIEEPGEGREDAVVLLLLGEEAEDGLGADEADGEPQRVVADRGVWTNERGTRHRSELAAAMMENELDMGQRLEATPEPRSRLAGTLGDGADATTIMRVQVEDAVGFREAKRAEDDCLGGGRGGDLASLERPPAGATPCLLPVSA